MNAIIRVLKIIVIISAIVLIPYISAYWPIHYACLPIGLSMFEQWVFGIMFLALAFGAVMTVGMSILVAVTACLWAGLGVVAFYRTIVHYVNTGRWRFKDFWW